MKYVPSIWWNGTSLHHLNRALHLPECGHQPSEDEVFLRPLLHGIMEIEASFIFTTGIFANKHFPPHDVKSLRFLLYILGSLPYRFSLPECHRICDSRRRAHWSPFHLLDNTPSMFFSAPLLLCDSLPITAVWKWSALCTFPLTNNYACD